MFLMKSNRAEVTDIVIKLIMMIGIIVVASAALYFIFSKYLGWIIFIKEFLF